MVLIDSEKLLNDGLRGHAQEDTPAAFARHLPRGAKHPKCQALAGVNSRLNASRPNFSADFATNIPGNPRLLMEPPALHLRHGTSETDRLLYCRGGGRFVFRFEEACLQGGQR